MWLGPKSASELKRKKVKGLGIRGSGCCSNFRPKAPQKTGEPQLHQSEEGFKETSRIWSPRRQKRLPPGTVGPN